MPIEATKYNWYFHFLHIYFLGYCQETWSSCSLIQPTTAWKKAVFISRNILLSMNLINRLCHCPYDILSGISPTICVRFYWVTDTMPPPFVGIKYFQLLDAGKPILISKGLLLLPCSLIPCFPPQDIWVPLFFVYHIFCSILPLGRCDSNSVYGEKKQKFRSSYD